MKILVIGGGFIATSIVERLEAEGHKLLIYSRTLNHRIQCQQILGDIFNFEDFLKALAWKPQVIIHSAWITTPGIYRNDLSNFKYATFTSQLARHICTSDVEHLIVLGTCAEYGKQIGPSTAGITQLTANSLYAEQKIAALNGIKAILMRSHTRLTWARIFYPYGPDQDNQRLIPHIILSLKDGNPILLDDTSSIHDWITTRDISSAISWIIANEVPTEIDVGTTLGYTNLQILITLEKLMQTTNKMPAQAKHSFGLNEILLAGEKSPLFLSGWSAKDTLVSGLEWVLGS